MRSILLLSLVGSIIAIGFSTSCYAKIDPETAVGIYLFEEEKGDEVVDHSGKGHNGTFGAGDGEWDDGKFGLAINIAEGSWIRVESTDALHPVDEWTIVAWFNINEMAGFHTIAAKWNEYLLRIDTPGEGSKLSAFIDLGDNWGQRASAAVPKLETWTHAALVWNNNDNGSLKVYMDGIQVGQSTRLGKVVTNDNAMVIGNHQAGGGWTWPGLLDEVGFFNVALEEDDIKLIMENGLENALGKGISVKPETALAAAWGEVKTR